MDSTQDAMCIQCPYRQGDFCVKLGDMLEMAGTCGDAIEGSASEKSKRHGSRKTGNAYRSRMKAIKKKRLAAIIRCTNVSLLAGPYLSDMESGHAFYIKYPSKGATRRWKDFKHRAARKIRHTSDIPNGNAYQKYEDSWGCW